MPEGWLTLSDVYNPLDAAVKAQQINDLRTQNRIKAMQMEEAAKEMKKRGAFKTWEENPQAPMALSLLGEQKTPQTQAALSPIAPPQGSPLLPTTPGMDQKAPNMGVPQGVTGTPQGGNMPLPGPIPSQQVAQSPAVQGQQNMAVSPMGAISPEKVLGGITEAQVTPEQQSVNRGAKVIGILTSKIQTALKQDPPDFKTVATANTMLQDSEDAQAAIKQTGYDKIELSSNEKEETATLGLTKNYSKEEITKLAEGYKGKGGELIANLPPGKYKFNINAINDRILPSFESIKEEGLGDKNLTDTQLAVKALKDKLNREPKASEVSEYLQKQKVDIARATTGAREEEKAKWKRNSDIEKKTEMHSFSTWTPEQKQYMFDRENIVGEKPKFAFGDRESYTTYQQEHAQYNIENQITPAMAGTSTSMFKSLEGSLKQQEKSLGGMGSFVINLNKQLVHADELLSKLPRTPSRLLNIPIWKLRTMVVGSGEEAAAKAYLLEISNEVGKLSTNSQASIRELSTDAQERWAKIHDELLPYNELKKVLDETQRLGNMRLESTKEQRDLTLNRMEVVDPKKYDYRTEKKESLPEEYAIKALPLAKENKGRVMKDNNGVEMMSDGNAWKTASQNKGTVFIDSKGRKRKSNGIHWEVE